MKGAIQRIFQEHGDRYIAENRDRLTAQHIKTIHAIQHCGTPAAGWLVFDCADCAAPHPIERSCGNRLCPTCQHGKGGEWLDRRLAEQLPTHYFMITFTVPQELHPLLLHEPQAGYTALFDAASAALKRLAADPRHLGADLPGFFGVLHTWGRTLQYHPHIHFVVPGGGLDKASGLWRSSRESFYAPGQALSKVFKGVFAERMRAANLHHHIDPAVWRKKWVVDSQAVRQNGKGVLVYLAPYVFRTAITDSRILSDQNGSVTFSYVKSGSRRSRKMTLGTMEFIRRYLLHVLPFGFMRIRRYGFMGSGCRVPHEELVALVCSAGACETSPIEHTPRTKAPFRCPACGGPLRCRAVLGPTGNVLAVHRPAVTQRE